jgi:CheY-like chemotaxis protein
VTVETSNVVLDREYLARNPVAKPGDFVLLAVSDSGAGIAPDIRDKIFEPFFTTKAKETSEARGLGLATIYGIARQNGGHISVYSEVGQGTTLKVYLPRSLGEAEPLAAAKPGCLQRGGESVLLVEDNDDLRESVADILDQLGYRVRVAADGRQGLAALAQDRRVDLVISDVVMPGLSGQEMARRIRETQPELPILFISGYTDNVVLRHGLLDGTFSFLEKPFTAERLGNKIREVLSPVPPLGPPVNGGRVEPSLT